MYHVRGRKHTNAVAGKPDAVKAARPVWWEAHGKGPSPRWYLAGCLPNGDISQCFDKLDHELLLSTLSEQIHDGRFIRLMRELFDAGYMEDWDFNQTLSGVPQGGVVSPILSNILLNKLDKFVETVLIPQYTRGVRRRANPEYVKLIDDSLRYRRQGKTEKAEELRRKAQTIPSKDVNDPNYRRLKYVRYADDFLLGFNGPKSEAEEIKQALRAFLRDELKLELSEEKTLITHARSEAARFLGYEVTTLQEDRKRSMTRKRTDRRSANGRIGFRVPLDILGEKCKRYKRGGKAVHRTELMNESDYTIVMTYQLEYRGIVNYYRFAYNMTKLHKLKWTMETSLMKTLAAKHRMTVSRIAKKYKAEIMVNGKKYTVLQASVPRKEKEPLVATWGGIPLAWDIRATLEERPPRMHFSYSELERRLLTGICEYCGSTEDVEMHHVRAMKNLHEYPGRPKPEWVKRMIALKRKTIPLCRPCHEDVHAGRPMRRQMIKLSEVKAIQKRAKTTILESRMR